GTDPGFYDLSVDCNNGDYMFTPSIFQVVNQVGPQIISISPAQAKPGQSLDVVITGINSHFTDGAMVSFIYSQGTSTFIPYSTAASSDVSMLLHLNIPANAVEGYYDLNLFDITDGILKYKSSFFVSSMMGIREKSAPELGLKVSPNPVFE